MAKFDIVASCLDYGRYLPACVASVLSHSIKGLRVLVFDDALTDDTLSAAVVGCWVFHWRAAPGCGAARLSRIS